MDDQDKVNINKFLCGLSNADNEHICENPRALSCMHYVCLSCWKAVSHNKKLKCKICDEINTNDLEYNGFTNFDLLLDANMRELLGYIYQKCKKLLSYDKSTNIETVDTHIQFLKEEIDIRIESLKIELDEIRDSLYKELENIKKDWIVSFNNINDLTLDENMYKGILNDLQVSISNHERMTKENLYRYQKHMKKLYDLNKEIINDIPSLNFAPIEFKIHKANVGKIFYDKTILKERHLLAKIRSNKHENIESDICPFDCCVFQVSPDSRFNSLLASNFDNRVLYTFFNLNMQQKFEYDFKVKFLTIDDVSNIYLTDHHNHTVIKMDKYFEKIAKFGCGGGCQPFQLYRPTGICFYNNSLFVCDWGNKRIKKISSLDMTHEATHKLDYFPLCIKNLNNIACVKGKEKTENSIYFYDLNEFTQIIKYSGHYGAIGVSCLFFYEYYSANKTIYIYYSDGQLREQIEIDGFGLNLKADQYSIFIDMRSVNAYISDCVSNTIIKI